MTLVSGSGSNGFLDALGAGLDGLGNATAGNFTTTFTTQYQAEATPVLAIPDFARGPDGTHVIKVPNDTAKGIPITLYNAVSASDVTFTLSYNPTLLTVTGGLGGSSSDATDSGSTFAMVGSPTIIDSMHAFASFHFSDATGQNGTVVLGDIVAVVPNSAANNYHAKELLQLGSIVINAPTTPITTAVSANGIHVNAYFGDVAGSNGVIDGLDVAAANSVANGTNTGFIAYPVVDPALVGDIAIDYTVDAGDVSDLSAYVTRLTVLQIPPPPSGLTITLTAWY